MTRQAIVFVIALASDVQCAIADEAADAVQVLSTVWKGTFDYGSTSQFVGDSKTFKMQTVTRSSDGTVSVLTSEAPFRYLESPDTFPSYLGATCLPERGCIFVRCLFDRDCIVQEQVTYDPVYQDPKLKGTAYFKRSEEGGAVKPADADNVKRALRTLMRLNAAPPFDPSAPR